MVRTTLKKIVYPCWKPSFMEGDSQNSGSRKADFGGIVDGLWWYEDSGKHVNGDFSMAVIQANNVLEDQCQLESGSLSSIDSGPQGTFVGIYDGHAGPEASRFINDHLFNNIKKYTSESEGMSDDVIRKAFLATDEQFISLVESQWLSNPKMASVGSCCLVGIICNGVLYIANAGDSRAVLAREEKAINGLKGVRVSEEHNASFESVREELRSLHPNDPNIVVLKHNVWRVRGLIQVICLTDLIFFVFSIPQHLGSLLFLPDELNGLRHLNVWWSPFYIGVCFSLYPNYHAIKISRSIGDVYLKKPEFNREPLLPKFILSESFNQPILRAEPAVLVQKLTPEDQFLICASDGLWEYLTDQEAVDMVKSSPQNGIARKLVKAALHKAAKKRNVSYSDLKKVAAKGGERRTYHDDITVIVLFLNHLSPNQTSWAPVSFKSSS